MLMDLDGVLAVTDLLLGAVQADGVAHADEERTVRDLLLKLTGAAELPDAVRERIATFGAKSFDLATAAATLRDAPLEARRRVLELLAKVHDADGELDFQEDDYLRAVAGALDVSEAEYSHLTVQIESEGPASMPPPPPPKRR